jgi:hypothetical protein
MHSFVALQMFAGTHSMHESVHLILIEPQASLHTFQTKLLHGPSGPHSPSGIISTISNSSITKIRRQE